MDNETYIAVGELVQAAAHLHGITGPVQFEVLSEPPASAGGQFLSEPGAIATGFVNANAPEQLIVRRENRA